MGKKQHSLAMQCEGIVCGLSECGWGGWGGKMGCMSGGGGVGGRLSGVWTHNFAILRNYFQPITNSKFQVRGSASNHDTLKT